MAFYDGGEIVSAASSKICTELIEQVVAAVEAKRLDMTPQGKAGLVRHMCSEILASGEEPPPDEYDILVTPSLVEEVVFVVETWLELYHMKIHPMDKAEMVRSICEEAVEAGANVKAIAWRELAAYTTGDGD